MRLQSPNPTHIFAAFPAALRVGAADGSRDGPPPGVCGESVPGRQVHRPMTSAPDTRAYNWPAASGQRPAAMTCARRQAGARRPAPSTSAGSRRPDAPPGRARARRLSLLPALALLLGALSLFAAAPAGAHHGEQTLLTATLTVDPNTEGTVLGCDEWVASIDNCSAALTNTGFTYEGTANTVTRLVINHLSPTNVQLILQYSANIQPDESRRLTLHIDGKRFRASSAYARRILQKIDWTETGLAWTDGQQVQVRLTSGLWTGVVLESAGFVPSSEGHKDLIVPEGGSATFGVKLSNRPTANVTVNLWKYAPRGMIHGDVNAATVSPKTLTFTPSNYSALQTVTVTGVQDGDADHEHLYIMASPSSTDTDYANPDRVEGVYVTVSDDGGAVQVGAWPAIGREAGNGTTSNVPVTLWLSRAATGTVVVDYRTANGTATAGSDYTAVAGSLAFAAGETRKTVQVPILDDNVEDSGETFYLVLSNPTGGASLEPGYTRALVEILNDEAHLDGLSVEGAAGAGGPWAKLDLGAFAAETTAYAVTVPHGTTHARLVPVTADEDLTLRAGSGTALTRVRSGESGPAVGLAVGANVLVVKTTAGTGAEKTYAVTVTRQAAAPPPPGTASLSALALSAGALGFAPETSTYATTVPYAVGSLMVTPTAGDSGATVTVNGVEVASGEASAPVALVAGETRIEVVVTAADGTTTRTYTVTVTRGPAEVALFPAASGTLQGFVRVVNESDEAGEVRIRAFDDAGEAYGPVTLAIGAGEARHFSSSDLESGNPAKGLTGATGPGQGRWRLVFESELAFRALGYVRTRAAEGFPNAVHDVVAQSRPSAQDYRYEVAFFNPASNVNAASVLLLVNRSASEAAEVRITGTDDAGRAGEEAVTLTLPAGASRRLWAPELESGDGDGLDGALGDGAGKWRLGVASDRPLGVMSLMRSLEGHLTNLSTAPPASR